jgi:hypothetical protein
MFFNTKIVLEAEGDEVVNIDDEAEEATDYNEGVDDEVADDTTEEETADDTEETTDEDTTEEEPTDEETDETDETPEDETEEPSEDEPTDYTEDVDAGETEDTTDDSSGDDSQDDSGYGSEPSGDDPNAVKNKALMKDFIELYDHIDNNMNKLDKIKSLDMITTEIINRVKYNFTSLSEYIYNYIRTIFNTKDYTDNLYTYKYIVQLYKICVQMLTKINDFGENT